MSQYATFCTKPSNPNQDAVETKPSVFDVIAEDTSAATYASLPNADDGGRQQRCTVNAVASLPVGLQERITYDPATCNFDTLIDFESPFRNALQCYDERFPLQARITQARKILQVVDRMKRRWQRAGRPLCQSCGVRHPPPCNDHNPDRALFMQYRKSLLSQAARPFDADVEAAFVATARASQDHAEADVLANASDTLLIDESSDSWSATKLGALAGDDQSWRRIVAVLAEHGKKEDLLFFTESLQAIKHARRDHDDGTVARIRDRTPLASTKSSNGIQSSRNVCRRNRRRLLRAKCRHDHMQHES